MAKNVKILLIEDDPFILKMYSTKFQLEKFEVKVADDGQKGMDAVGEFQPDIILLDLMMPQINGFDVLQMLKGAEATAKIPVIVLSNLSQEYDIKRAKELGAADYIVKTELTPREVVEKIKGLVG
jgi:DNA-binding response OmpR family regulator